MKRGCAATRDDLGYRCAPCRTSWVGIVEPPPCLERRSCGCVFCDLMLYPNGAGLHATEEGPVKCGRLP